MTLFFHLTQLQWIDLANNQLTFLSEKIRNFQDLKWLNVENNLMTELPEGIGHLENLIHLEVVKDQHSNGFAHLKGRHLSNTFTLPPPKQPDLKFREYTVSVRPLTDLV